VEEGEGGDVYDIYLKLRSWVLTRLHQHDDVYEDMINVWPVWYGPTMERDISYYNGTGVENMNKFKKFAMRTPLTPTTYSTSHPS